MIKTPTMLAHIKGSTRDFLYQFQEENGGQKVQYEGEISWEVSSTIITDSLHLRFYPTDRVFTPYRVPKANTRLEAHIRITAVIAPDAMEGLEILSQGCAASAKTEKFIE